MECVVKLNPKGEYNMTIENKVKKELNGIEEELKEEELKKEELKERFFLRVTKRKSVEYNDIYEVTLPVTFYFDTEDAYDGLSFETDDITEEEAVLLEELLDRLADAEDMSVTDEQMDDETSE